MDSLIYRQLFGGLPIKNTFKFENTHGHIFYKGVPPYKRETPKIGRNEPCPCGSGLKFKKCCLKAGDVPK